MKFETAVSGAEMKITMSESLNFDDHGTFRDMLAAVTESKSKRCILDLSRLLSIDSAGLGMLMVAQEASDLDKWKLILSAPRGQVPMIRPRVGMSFSFLPGRLSTWRLLVET